jgi:hypothetical protein
MEIIIIIAIIVGICNGFHAMKMARINPEKYGSKPQKRYWYFRNHGMGMGFRTDEND